jgi:DNA modification methylase
MIFWFSMKHYYHTLDFFHKFMPSLSINPFPLIWMKSDNKGILPDHKRGPRQIYETALLCSRGDRYIINAVANAYHGPTDREHHPSTKPEPMLKHFFQMLVDENTRLLDPTCGGGSALRAAESLGAKFVFGIEESSDFVVSARQALKRSRVLRKLSTGGKK